MWPWQQGQRLCVSHSGGLSHLSTVPCPAPTSQGQSEHSNLMATLKAVTVETVAFPLGTEGRSG